MFPYAVGIIYTIVSLLFLSNLVFDVDEGIALYNAWQFWNGNLSIYTDRFIEYISPGTSLSVYYVWRMVGTPEYIFAYGLFMLFWAVGLLSLLLVTKKLSIKMPFSLILIFYWLAIFKFTSRINHNAFGAAIGILLLYKLIGLKNWQTYIVAGIINGLLLWFHQSLGLAYFLAALTYYALTNKRFSNLLIYILGFLMSSVGLMSLTGFKNTLYSLFILPFKLNYLSANISQLNPWLIIAAFICTVTMILTYVKRGRKEYLLLGLIQIFLYIGSFHNFNSGHLILASLPVAIFLGLVMSDFMKKSKNFALMTLSNVLILALGCYVIVIALSNLNKPKFFEFDLYNKFKTANIQRAKSIYAGPYLPAVYYYAGKTNSYSLSHIDISDKANVTKIFHEIIKTKPEIAFINYDIIRKLNYNRNNAVDNYIRRNYTRCNKTIMGTLIYVVSEDYCP